MTRMVMVMDQRRCIGCDSCTVACRTWNELPLDIIYNPVVTEGVQGEFPNVHKNWTPLICMHCSNPPCVPCCPTGASQVDEDGTVWVDYEKCMGCKVCINACPYGSRDSSEFLPLGKRYAMKCTFCRTLRQDDPNAVPHCVKTCHQKARYFGDIDDPTSEVSKIVGSTETFKIFEELGTEPNIYYIPARGGVI